MTQAFLEIRNLSFSRGTQRVLSHVSFSLEESQLGALVGPSGSGKTTLLRLIAGFESPESGQIFLNNFECSNSHHVTPPEKRGVGVVFQDFALFPHLSVRENVGYALYKQSRETRDSRVDYLLKLLSLENLASRFPHELSGGQQQRVAIGRALAPHPTLLLLDEPFSQLDPELREELIHVLKNVLAETRVTTLLVTHHQEDAFDLAQSLGVLHNGKLLQWGDPFELYHSPSERFVADFIGKGLFVPATVIAEGRVSTEIGEFDCDTSWKVGENCELLVRPDDILHVDSTEKLQGEILKKRFRGSLHLYTLKLASGRHILAEVPSHHNHRIGEKIGLDVDMTHVNLFRKVV